MPDQTVKHQPTVITLVLPAEGEEKPASLTIKQGDVGHVSTFTYQDFATICRAINTGLGKFLAVQANPPNDIESTAKKVRPTKKAKVVPKDNSAGQPPYHLLDAAGKRRELMTMTDPFDVTEKCLKNRRFVFDDLAEAEEIGQMLVAAGEKKITIAYKKGQTAKIIGGEDTEEPTAAETPAAVVGSAAGNEEPAAEYPEAIDDEIKQALYAHLQDTDRVLALYEAVNKIKKHDWTNDLIKQREVKGAIHKHTDEDKVEAIYAIFYQIEHTPATDEEVVGERRRSRPG
jgi:hypothetical protein